MRLQQYAQVLKEEAGRWAKMAKGKERFSEPHPADVILQVLDEIRSRVPQNRLGQVPDLENLANKVKFSRPKWPSFEFLSGQKSVIDDIQNLASFLHKSESEVPWDNNNPDYMAASDAIVHFTDDQISLPQLSKLLRPDGRIRYMRKKGQQATGPKTRCRLKVHKEDFRQWTEFRYPSEKQRQRIIEKELRKIGERREDIDSNKEHLRKMLGDSKLQ